MGTEYAAALRELRAAYDGIEASVRALDAYCQRHRGRYPALEAFLWDLHALLHMAEPVRR